MFVFGWGDCGCGLEWWGDWDVFVWFFFCFCWFWYDVEVVGCVGGECESFDLGVVD